MIAALRRLFGGNERDDEQQFQLLRELLDRRNTVLAEERDYSNRLEQALDDERRHNAELKRKLGRAAGEPHPAPALSGPVIKLLNELLDDEFASAVTWLGLEELFLSETGELVARTDDGFEERAAFDPERPVLDQIADLDAKLRLAEHAADQQDDESPAADDAEVTP